ncbi:MAG: BACON domain-containing protein, partial [Bacteroidales bacterium]|nr:BACON domain-containing protein [Bacteroidales bacterium]
MNIKKLFSSFAAAILVFAACEETNPDLGDPSVTLSKTQLEFAKEGGSQEITLNSTRDWSVLNRPEWVSITPEKGAASAKDQTIVISVMDNADAPRSCVITFIGTTARADLAIVQDGDGV